MKEILITLLLIVVYDSFSKKNQANFCLVFPLLYGCWLDLQSGPIEHIEVCIGTAFAVFLLGIYKHIQCQK